MQDVFQLKMERLKQAQSSLVGELTTANKILKQRADFLKRKEAAKRAKDELKRFKQNDEGGESLERLYFQVDSTPGKIISDEFKHIGQMNIDF